MKGKGLQKRLVDETITNDFNEFCDEVYSITILDSRKWQSHALRKLSKEANTFFSSRDKDTKEVLQGILAEQNTFSKSELEILRKQKKIEYILNIKKERVLLLTALLFGNRRKIPQKFDQVKYSYAFRFYLACYVLELWWISNGGIDIKACDKLENDIIDMSYVAYGTFYDGVLSRDKKLKEIYIICQKVIEEI